MADRKTPSKPKPTTATTAQLMAHYGRWCVPYNQALIAKYGDKEETRAGFMEPFAEDYPEELVIRAALIERIRKQNHRLGRTIRPRAQELLCHKRLNDDGSPMLNADNRTVGYSYAEVIDLLAVEFPEGSTSIAALRWYVTHMRSDADEEGLPWPDMPQVRPRSRRAAAPAPSAPPTSAVELALVLVAPTASPTAEAPDYAMAA